MILYTADREAGNRIEEVITIDEGKERIREYEEHDKRNGEYTPDFYDIINSDGISQL